MEYDEAPSDQSKPYPKPGEVFMDRHGGREVLGYKGNTLVWRRPGTSRVFRKWLPYWREWQSKAERDNVFRWALKPGDAGWYARLKGDQISVVRVLDADAANLTQSESRQSWWFGPLNLPDLDNREGLK